MKKYGTVTFQFCCFCQAVEDSSSSNCFSSELLYLSVYLTKLAVETKALPSSLVSGFGCTRIGVQATNHLFG